MVQHVAATNLQSVSQIRYSKYSPLALMHAFNRLMNGSLKGILRKVISDRLKATFSSDNYVLMAWLVLLVKIKHSSPGIASL